MKFSKIFLIFLLSSFLIVPALAEINLMTTIHYDNRIEFGDVVGSFSYNSAENDRIIQQVYFDVLGTHDVDILIHLNSGTTIPAHVYSDGLISGASFEIGIDAQTQTFPNFGIGGGRAGISYAVENATTAPIYYIAIYEARNLDPFSSYPGIYDPPLFHQLASAPSQDPIVQIDFVSTIGVYNLVITESDIETQATAETDHETGTGTQLDWLFSLITPIWDALLFAWGIFYFFFIEHLFLMILLVEGAIFAYETNTRRDIFKALSAIAQDNIKLFEFSVGAVQKIISVVWDLVNLFNPLRWVFGK